MLPTVDWQGDTIVMVDQRKLPGQELYVRCRTAQEVARAIRTMVIRGAPAIGVAAAMGIALGMRRNAATGTRQYAVELQKICDMMAATRPTAVNLRWALDRMAEVAADGDDALLDRAEAAYLDGYGAHDEARLLWHRAAAEVHYAAVALKKDRHDPARTARALRVARECAEDLR